MFFRVTKRQPEVEASAENDLPNGTVPVIEVAALPGAPNE